MYVGVRSEPQMVIVFPVPESPFIINLPAPNSQIVYSPNQLVFNGGQFEAEFTAIGTLLYIFYEVFLLIFLILTIAYTTTFNEAGPTIPGQVQPITTSLNAINITGRDGGEFQTYNIPLSSATSVNVVPGNLYNTYINYF